MTNVRKVVPGQVLQDGFPSSMFNGLADLLSTPASNKPGSATYAPSRGVAVKAFNGTGADLSRFSCAALGEPRFSIDDGNESLIFDLEEADENKPAAILTGPIADQKRGDVMIFGLAIARVAAGDPTNLFGLPDASGVLTPSSTGPVRLLSAPANGDTQETLRPVLVGAGASAGGVTLYRYVLSASMAEEPAGSGKGQAAGSVTPVPSGTTINNIVLHDDNGNAAHQVAGDVGYALESGGEFHIIEPQCDPDAFDDGSGGPGPV